MYFFSFLHFPFDTPSLMEIPFSMLLYEGWGARGGLCIRAMDMAVLGWGGVEKKIVKKAAPSAAVCECVWVKKRSLIDTIDSEASRLRLPSRLVEIASHFSEGLTKRWMFSFLAKLRDLLSWPVCVVFLASRLDGQHLKIKDAYSHLTLSSYLLYKVLGHVLRGWIE